MSKLKKKKRKLINLDKFEGKYIKYHDTYMLVDCIMKDVIRYTNYDYCYMFRGLGFLVNLQDMVMLHLSTGIIGMKNIFMAMKENLLKR